MYPRLAGWHRDTTTRNAPRGDTAAESPAGQTHTTDEGRRHGADRRGLGDGRPGWRRHRPERARTALAEAVLGVHAHRLTGNADAAWDVTQEAWLGIVKGLGKLHDPARFKPWAYQIVTNKAIDLLKSRRVTRPLPDVLATTSSPDDDDVGRLLSRLDPDKRVVLVLFYVEDLSIAEIAAMLKIPPGTVKSRLFKARDAFRSLWQQGLAKGDRK
jgi:RNA polymerase sigma factor (sigma-70 family)